MAESFIGIRPEQRTAFDDHYIAYLHQRALERSQAAAEQQAGASVHTLHAPAINGTEIRRRDEIRRAIAEQYMPRFLRLHRSFVGQIGAFGMSKKSGGILTEQWRGESRPITVFEEDGLSQEVILVAASRRATLIRRDPVLIGHYSQVVDMRMQKPAIERDGFQALALNEQGMFEAEPAEVPVRLDQYDELLARIEEVWKRISY